MCSRRAQMNPTHLWMWGKAGWRHGGVHPPHEPRCDCAAKPLPGASRLGGWAELPDIVHDVAERWSLRLGEPYQPGDECSWVAPVHDLAGRELVLKVGWRHYEAAHEADGLRSWAGRGAVLLHDALDIGATSMLLLERCRPGTALGRGLPEPDQDLIVASTLKRLWSAQTDGYPFRPLQTMCDAWASEFEDRLTTSPGLVDPGLARAGMQLLRSLPATSERTVLLSTDLHAGNILSAQREPWLVIDPKPYVGDPTYDPLQHMLNCKRRLSVDPVGLVRRMNDLLGLDADRLTLWLFARCMKESIDQAALRRVAVLIAPE